VRRSWIDRIGAFLKGSGPDDAATDPDRARADRLIASGREAERQGRLTEACARYRAAVEAAPDYADAHLNLGIALEASGDGDGAFRAFGKVIVLDPANAYGSYNLGRLEYLRGNHARAEQQLRLALRHRPEFPEANLTLGYVCRALGNAEAAMAALELARRQRPDDFGALMEFSLLATELGRLADAEAALRRALALDPDAVDPPNLLARLLVEQGRRDEAAACLQQAIALHPESADLRLNLGNVHAERPDYDAAIACYREALRLEPQLLEAHQNLAHSLHESGNQDEALAHYRQSLLVEPGNLVVRWSYAMAQIPAIYRDALEPGACRAALAQELDELERAAEAASVEQRFDAVAARQPFYLVYQEENNRELLARYGALSARIMRDWFGRQRFETPRGNPRDGRLRVGMVSKYFCNHSVWNAILKDWTCNLDAQRIFLGAICLGPDEDAETACARTHAAHFEKGSRSFHRWVETILRLQFDVLVYPEIGMDRLTARLAALRLAPIQATTWGQPETSGLPTIDHFLSAADLEAPQPQGAYTENLVLLPRLGCCWRGDTAGPVLPDGFGGSLDAGVPLLVCPGTPFKYAPQQDWVYAEIARQLGNCRLIFFLPRNDGRSRVLQRRLAAAFERVGLDPARHVTFLGWQSRAAFYGLLSRADVFLDTIGFSGFNTAMDAVHCGLPIVTREGRFLRGRLASGILRRIGLEELIVATEQDYVTLAVRICRDADYREHLRRRLLAGVPVLTDDKVPVRALERFLLESCSPAATV
jgi:protein O-GlcNAc transferase